MKKTSAIWLQLFMTACACAQASDAGSPAPDVAAERSRIQVERAQAESRYVQEQAACYARFAVNDCLRDARARRRQAVDRLRRQEVSFNDAERQRRALEQRQQIKDGSAGQR